MNVGIKSLFEYFECLQLLVISAFFCMEGVDGFFFKSQYLLNRLHVSFVPVSNEYAPILLGNKVFEFKCSFRVKFYLPEDRRMLNVSRNFKEFIKKKVDLNDFL